MSTSCAKRGVITGGPKDTLAPKIVSSIPKNFSSNFTNNEIVITFDEYVKIKDISKQLIISPPLEKQPTIVPQGSASKFISITFNDTLQKNTTYSFNFGQSITDYNEGNPYSQYKYVFSTGDYIDSLTVVGKIKDAYYQNPDKFVTVALYDASKFKDSTIYTNKPLYVTNTLDSLKVFSLENLKAAKYYIFAFKDANSNYKYEPKYDKIAFFNEPITVPTSTLYELELFKEELDFKAEKPTQESQNKFYLGFEGNPKNTKIKAKSNNKELSVKWTKFKTKNKDTLQLFIPKIEADSIEFTVENNSYSKTFVSKIKNIKEVDSLAVTAIHNGVLSFRDTFTLQTSVPLSQIDVSKIAVLKKDSTAVDFKHYYDEFEQEIKFDFKKEEKEKYSITLLPNALTDIYDTKNDTLSYTINTKEYADYGNLLVKLKNKKYNSVIVELANAKGETIYSIATQGNAAEFQLINPNIYTLRLIYDTNENGVWDTGNYLKKRQPEEIIYFEKEIDVRANWDVEQEFDLK